MSTVSKRRTQTQTMVLGAVLTAIVVILQYMGAFVRFGAFQISLVLIPIVIGAAVCGVWVGAWLGLVFGAVVLLNGDATLFMNINAAGTIITVLAKGIACGLISGIVYKLLEKFNRYFAVIAAAIVCPIVNTGVFVLGCFTFFFETMKTGAGTSGNDSILIYILVTYVGLNFFIELAANMILSPIITRVLQFIKK